MNATLGRGASVTLLNLPSLLASWSQTLDQGKAVNAFGNQIVEAERTSHGKLGDDLLLRAFIGEHRLFARGPPDLVKIDTLPH